MDSSLFFSLQGTTPTNWNLKGSIFQIFISPDSIWASFHNRVFQNTLCLLRNREKKTDKKQPDFSDTKKFSAGICLND